MSGPLPNAMVARQRNPFISTWNTANAGTSASNQITIPTISSGLYNCVVNWGDGTTSSITTYNSSSWTHTYPSSGTYTVSIYGTFVGIYFNNTGDRLKILNIVQWGTDFKLGTSQGNYFFGCGNLNIIASDAPNLLGTTSFFYAFANCASLTSPASMSFWNTSTINNMDHAFYRCFLLNANLTWNVSAVTNMSYMFYNCTVFTGGGLSSWDTSAVTIMSYMFYLTSAFNANIPWNTTALTNLDHTFFNAIAFTGLGLSSWNTANVTNMNSTFGGAVLFNTNLPWNTASVTGMNATFNNATSFNQTLNWNTSSVTNTGFMFSGATAFTGGGVSSWNVANLTVATSMFLGVTLPKSTYNAILSLWSAQTLKRNVAFGGGNSHYDTTTGGYNGTAGRLVLTATYAWTVTDGGTP